MIELKTMTAKVMPFIFRFALQLKRSVTTKRRCAFTVAEQGGADLEEWRLDREAKRLWFPVTIHRIEL
jgi:hypothetical protein